jgi:RNA polymerase sigma-70 factor, ECF subfamily
MTVPPHSSGGDDERPAETSRSEVSERNLVYAAIRGIRLGNREAYRQIIELYQRRLFSLALMVVHDRAGAQDIVQDAFLRAYTHLDRFDEQRNLYAWLATITVRLAYNWRRSRAHLEYRSDLFSPEEHEPTQDIVGELMDDERSRHLWRCVSSLSQGQRTAILLYYRQDMKIDEVAEVLGVTTGTVKALLFRAREKLRAIMSDHESAGMSKEENRT